MPTIIDNFIAYLSGPAGVIVGLLVSIVGIPASAYLGHWLALRWPSSQKKKIDDRINWMIESAISHSNKTEIQLSGILVTINFMASALIMLIVIICTTFMIADIVPRWMKLLVLIIAIIATIRITFSSSKTTYILRTLLQPKKEIEALNLALQRIGNRVYQTEELRKRQEILQALSSEFENAYEMDGKFNSMKLT